VRDRTHQQPQAACTSVRGIRSRTAGAIKAQRNIMLGAIPIHSPVSPYAAAHCSLPGSSVHAVAALVGSECATACLTPQRLASD